MKKAIVLGGTVPHIELINQLKKRGFYVILIDYLENPVAREFADEHIQESTLDKEAVYKIALKENVELVIATSVDQANVTCCYVMEKLGLNPPYSYEIAKRITNKVDMKKTMLKYGVPTSKFVDVSCQQDFSAQELKFPLIIKPSDSNSSKGVKVAHSLDETKKYIREALEISRNGLAIVEEFVEGPEVSIYCFVDLDGNVHVLLISHRITKFDNKFNAIKGVGTISNMNISNTVENKIEYSANTIAQAYGLKNTAFFMQAIISNDNLSIIEFAPRTGGGMCFETVKRTTGFDYIGSSIDSFSGIDVNVQTQKSDKVCAVNVLYAKEGVFSHIDEYKYLINDKTILCIYPIKTKGMEFVSGTATSERVAFILTEGDTVTQACQKIEIAMKKIKVYDINSNEILRRDLHVDSHDIKE